MSFNGHGARVEPEVCACDDAVGIMVPCPAQNGVDAGDKFFGRERLGEVVVGSGVEAGDLLRGVSKYGSDDDGCHDSVPFDFPNEVDSRPVGEHPVGNHDFRRIAMNLLKPVLFGRGNDHMMEMRG